MDRSALNISQLLAGVPRRSTAGRLDTTIEILALGPELGVIAPQGEYDMVNSPVLQDAIEAAAGSYLCVVVDFSATKFIDSTVMAIVFRAMNTMGSRFGAVVPRGCRARRVFDIVDGGRSPNVFESLEQARAMLESV